MKAIFAVLVLASVMGCGDAKKDDFNRSKADFLQAESALSNVGCILNEQNPKEPALDCTGVRERDIQSLESALSNYVSHGSLMLENDGKAEKKFMTDDERANVQRKIMVANKVRAAVVKVNK